MLNAALLANPDVHAELPDHVKCHLENAEITKVELSRGGPYRLFLKGWVHAPEPEADIWIKVHGKNFQNQVLLDQEREDISNALRSDAGRCNWGFQHSLSAFALPDTVWVSIVINGTSYLWQTLCIKPADEYACEIIGWRALHQNDFSAIDAGFELSPSKVDELICALHAQHVQVELNESTILEGVEPEFAKFLIDCGNEMNTASVAEQMLNQALDEGCLTTKATFRTQSFRCDSSFTIGDLNFLRYTGSSEVIYVIQYCYSAVGLYSPSCNLSLAWSAWSNLRDWCRLINQYSLLGFKGVYRYLNCDSRKFGSFLIGNSRPYHYYYDQFAVFEHLARTRNGVVPLLIMQKFAFAEPISSDMKTVSYVEGHDAVNALNYREQTFSVLIGGRNSSVVGRPATEEIFGYVSEQSKNDFLNDTERLARVNKLRGRFPVVWVGISSQKRVWAEQESGLANIINRVADCFPACAVIFDGWTSPLRASMQDIAETESDRKLAARIREAIPEHVHCESVIGATSAEKILFACAADCYVTNWLQGSLHIDNICRKTGVGHFNTKWVEFDDKYYHHACLRIADEDIKNLSDDRADLVSYSIDWNIVYSRFLDALEQISVRAVRSLN